MSELVWGPSGIDQVAESLACASVPVTFTSCDQGTACGLEFPWGVTAGSDVEEECETGTAVIEPAANFAARVELAGVETMYCSTGEPVE